MKFSGGERNSSVALNSLVLFHLEHATSLLPQHLGKMSISRLANVKFGLQKKLILYLCYIKPVRLPDTFQFPAFFLQHGLGSGLLELRKRCLYCWHRTMSYFLLLEGSILLLAKSSSEYLSGSSMQDSSLWNTRTQPSWGHAYRPVLDP